jgi:hypothetical protein
MSKGKQEISISKITCLDVSKKIKIEMEKL